MRVVLVAQVILMVVATYILAGVFAALAFVFLGVHRVDPMAKGAGWVFRIMILPGCIALWPLVVTKWIRAIRRMETRT